MAEIDLVPGGYRRVLALRTLLRRFGLVYLVVLALLAVAKVGLAYGVRGLQGEIERLDEARAVERARQAQLAQLRDQHGEAERRVRILSGLRGGVAARDMFRVVDRASDGAVWFLDWKFRRAGEVVDGDPGAVHAGYFLVVPLEEAGEERDKAWLMQTHMEIRGRAVDHSTLAGFVRRLVEQPEIEEARVLSTSTRRYTALEVVDFELAVVVRTAA
jgi:hypothetical protein